LIVLLAGDLQRDLHAIVVDARLRDAICCCRLSYSAADYDVDALMTPRV